MPINPLERQMEGMTRDERIQHLEGMSRIARMMEPRNVFEVIAKAEAVKSIEARLLREVEAKP